ncbi:tyrosine-protein phosphatase [Acetatifactor aquisgranensis]|uniref:tyrosine-protein phosphatase n=1 Tax=Acetatifactor aquisgranensis TaxID=2941233 RepID=UPI00203E63D5|nr:tyrosine-protein phosphatase [Acetatifactor aquisgranensis]
MCGHGGLGNVADIDIIADYEVSNAYLYQMSQIAKNVPGGIPDFLLYIKSEYMDAVLSFLREKYGTIEDYLLKKGISKTEIEMLKKKLLE